ncbi:MAG: hypothetical protein LBC47_05900 [Tannerella sp.]|nr:hypothetical protein [Tannerella sp.]
MIVPEDFVIVPEGFVIAYEGFVIVPGVRGKTEKSFRYGAENLCGVLLRRRGETAKMRGNSGVRRGSF